jgi:hypothetical protein
MLDPCPIFSGTLGVVSLDACHTFADGSVYQGMAVGLTRYFENIRYILTMYQAFAADPLANFSLISKGYGLYLNNPKLSNQTNNFFSLINFN